ncbi:DNA repair protein RecN [Corynebacterium sp. HS2168-gen11]|uniref:DNA repair protein RecN n=1 Tax=Corynebacterium sp. HS2168-gen11 TaxID=2974027 RepID=UPI00216B12D4|nr:DNA repair protein RecN [Corynebacterium sp. HS2168-gen11]MCS4535027.1 DNA repair protein RecN [Corynebacterium sp. HS2168-gen11]
MLADIAIQNLGVIPHATVELSEGLTVLTGETGAGKTMVVTGLRLLVGGRADASRVRTGSTAASVEGRFRLDTLPSEIASQIFDFVTDVGGIPDENQEIIASRSVSAQGRSKAYLGGRAVPAAHLGKFSAELLTIHGQNDQLRLLAPDQQLAALDRVDPAIAGLKQTYQEHYKRWRSLDKQLQERIEKRRELAQESDRLDFAIQEIVAVDPQPGEDIELVATIRRLQDVDDIREIVTTAIAKLDGLEALGEYAGGNVEEEYSASSSLGEASAALSHSDDPILAQLGQRLHLIVEEVAEISGELGSYYSGLPVDPLALEHALERQQELKKLTRKYAPTIDEVLVWLAKAEAKRASIDISPAAFEQLQRDVAQARQQVNTTGAALTNARQAAAKSLESLVTEELHGLAMPHARLTVALQATKPGPDGLDAVEFLLAHNKAAEPRPLATSASGGELSRVMLALEVILAAGTRGTTLVFDEVDAGVGGRAAVEIGRRLARLALHTQVIVVTHLPQVAAYADTHVHVAKEVSDESVVSGVENLSEQRRIEELSRMLAGLDDTETGRAHALELFRTAQEEVAALRNNSATIQK